MQPVLKSLLLGLLFFVARLQAQSDSDEVQADIASQLRDKYLVILCAESDFTAAKREAERVSVASGVQFSMNGRVWDPNRGLFCLMCAMIRFTAESTCRVATASCTW